MRLSSYGSSEDREEHRSMRVSTNRPASWRKPSRACFAYSGRAEPLISEQFKINVRFTYEIRSAITIVSQHIKGRSPFIHGVSSADKW
jgi:hypothetical protein